MTHSIKHLCLLLLLATAAPLYGEGRYGRQYTEENPVTIISDWDFAPYEYLGESGEPTGYNIDLLSMIFKRLNLPYKFVLNELQATVDSFNTHKADIIVGIPANSPAPDTYISKLPLHYYKLAVATIKIGEPLNKSLDKLTPDDGIVAVKRGDYAEQYLATHPCRAVTEYRTPKEGLTGVVSKKIRGYIWGEQALKWKTRSLHLEYIRIDSINIPMGNLHIIGYDQQLISAIDDQFARLRQEGEIELLNEKWFHPEEENDNSSYLLLFIVSGVVIAGLIIFVLSRLVQLRVKKALQNASDVNQMMKQALSMGDYFVFVHDLKEDVVTNEHGYLLPEKGVTIDQFANMLHPDDRAFYHDNLRNVRNGKLPQPVIDRRLNIGTADNPKWIRLAGSATIESENGQPRFIFNTVKNLTREMDEERRDKEMGARFFQLFDTNLVAMSFYNPDGVLLDYNQQMKQLCGIKDEESDNYFRQTNIFDTALIKGEINPGLTEEIQFCQHMYYPEQGVNTYIEVKIMPYFDDEGAVRHYVVAVRDISSVREQHIALRKHERELRQTNETINQYEHELAFLLGHSDMFTFRSNNKERSISFSQSLQDVQFRMTFEMYLECLYEEDRVKAAETIRSFERMRQPFNKIRHFQYSPNSEKPAWYAISAMPVYDKQGEVVGHFGVARDITQLMEANEQLRRETQRAENSGLQKSAFLANMTHEIRTPLNAIVGFSDLLPTIEDENEKQELIRIIRNNCDMLLRLINDILEASDMSSKPLDIETKDVDFAQAFDDICQTLAQRVQEPGVEFIKDNPYTTLPTRLDKGRVQQVITNFVTNAVKYTHKGHIKVGYIATPAPADSSLFTLHSSLPQKEGLYIYCEDTGAGIPKDKQASVFERFVKLDDFVQGTGLGLAICKSIAERYGGQIGVNSEGVGHGSTFWFWIPCPLPSTNHE